MDFPFENKSGGNFSPKFIFIWRSHIKISENCNFQTAVKIVWQVILTQNFAFRHKFRCRIRIWHPFCSRFNGYHKPRFDVENRLRELFLVHFRFSPSVFQNVWVSKTLRELGSWSSYGNIRRPPNPCQNGFLTNQILIQPVGHPY